MSTQPAGPRSQTITIRDDINFFARFKLAKGSGEYNLLTAIFAAINSFPPDVREKIEKGINSKGDAAIAEVKAFLERSCREIANADNPMAFESAKAQMQQDLDDVVQSLSGTAFTADQCEKIGKSAIKSEAIAIPLEEQRRKILEGKMERIYTSYEQLKSGDTKNLLTAYSELNETFFSGEELIKYDGERMQFVPKDVRLDNPTCSDLIRYDGARGEFISNNPDWQKYADMANDLRGKVDASWESEPIIVEVKQEIETAKQAAKNGDKEAFLISCRKIVSLSNCSFKPARVVRALEEQGKIVRILPNQDIYESCGHVISYSSCFGPALDGLCRDHGWGPDALSFVIRNRE